MPPKVLRNNALYEFGPFRVDAGQRTLLRQGELIGLAPKAFETLLALLDNAGRVVEKSELLQRVWPDTFVEEGSLSQNISILRKALGEYRAAESYIQTIPKRGYRFVGEVRVGEVSCEPPSLAVLSAAEREARSSNRVRHSLVWGLAALVLATGAIYWWQGAHVKPLTDKDVLVLADFTNSAGEAVFDGTLREALAFQLEQSPFLKVLDDEAVRQDLQLMRRSPQERVTNELAREICMREAQKAMIGGSIARLGGSYVIELKATACQTGATLARQQTQAADKDHVLRALTQAAQGIRARLGESLSSIQKLAPPEFQVTTNSLEAFQAFAMGQKLFAETRYAESVPLFERATELDPDLAMAYHWLASASTSTGGGGDPDRIQEYADKAYALRDRVSAYERFWIGVPGFRRTDRAEALRHDELWARTYPRDSAPLVFAALIHTQMGEFEEALRLILEAYRMEPRRRLYAAGVMTDYLNLDRLAEAKSVAAAHFARGFDDPQVHEILMRIAWMEGDQESAARQMQWFAGTPEERIALEQEAAQARMSGQLRQSQELLEHAADLARRRGLPEAAARLLAPNADGDALLGNCAAARKTGAATAITLAFCEDASMVERTGRFAADRSKWRGKDPLWSRGQLPLLHAAIEYGRGQPERVVPQLESVKPYERALPFAMYLRGLAYLRLKQGGAASAEFQRIVDHRGANWGPMYPLAYLGLARASRIAGENDRASKAYEDFLALWSHADSELPLVREVREEFAELTEEEKVKSQRAKVKSQK